MDSGRGTNETDFIKRYLISGGVKVLSYFEIAGLDLASDLLPPTIPSPVPARALTLLW